jgi:dihydrodipicolinate synthase/N-acetylneuraminate lyase
LCAKESVSAILVRSGESRIWSYSLEEVRDAIRCVVSVARGRKPVIACTAGIWAGDLKELPRPAVYFRRASDLSQYALASGAAAVMQPVPYMLEAGSDYGPQDVVVRYFEDLARVVNGPMLIYNQGKLPPGYALTACSLERLSQIDQYVGVLYDTADVGLLSNIVRVCSPRFCVMGGNEAVTLPGFAGGATAVAGLLSTVLPELVSAAWRSLAEPNLPFGYRAQSDLLESRELLAPWSAGDVGCALFAHQGMRIAARNREGGRVPMKHEVDGLLRRLHYLRAAYM